MRTSYVSGRSRLERRLPAALVLVPVELSSLAGGFTDVFGEIQQRIGWRGRSEDDLQSFVSSSTICDYVFTSARSRTMKRLSAS